MALNDVAGGAGKSDHTGHQRGREGLGAGSNRGGGNGGANMDSRARNLRYEPYRIATRPATVGNIATALGMGVGFGPATGFGMIGGNITGAYDPFSGPVGHTTGFGFDAHERMVGTGGGLMSQAQPNSLGGQWGPAQQRLPISSPMAPVQTPNMQSAFMPSQQLSVGGATLPAYGAQAPGYGYFTPNGPPRMPGRMPHTPGIR